MASKGIKDAVSGGPRKRPEMTSPTEKKRHEQRTKPVADRDRGDKDRERHSGRKHLRVNVARDHRGKLDLDCLERRLLTLRKVGHGHLQWSGGQPCRRRPPGRRCQQFILVGGMVE